MSTENQESLEGYVILESLLSEALELGDDDRFYGDIGAPPLPSSPTLAEAAAIADAQEQLTAAEALDGSITATLAVEDDDPLLPGPVSTPQSVHDVARMILRRVAKETAVAPDAAVAVERVSLSEKEVEVAVERECPWAPGGVRQAPSQAVPVGRIWASAAIAMVSRRGWRERRRKEADTYAVSWQAAFATPKPERLLNRIVQIGTDPGDMVLDCFLGAGTTTAVAHKTGQSS